MSLHEFEIEWELMPNEFEIELGSVVKEIYPELEDLEVVPSGVEQNFKSNKYGYDNVKVKAVESEELHIIPTNEKQHFEGLYGSVDVDEITGETLDITPSKESQTYSGIYETVNVEGVKGDTLEVVPTTENQVKEGLYSKVTVEGDSELLPENIKKGTNIFGVEGTLEIVLTKEEYVNCLEIAENILNETEYTELQYIESTGTQYIDTGLKLTQNHKLEMTISHFDTNGNRRTFGSRASATSNNFSVVSGPVGGTMSIVADFHNYQNNRLAYVIDGDEKIDISISNKLLKINDMEKEVTTYDNFTTPDNAYLFNCSGSYPAGYESAAMRLYMCKIYENDILVRSFVPVQRKKDGEICMYDTVEKKYYLNLGTGKFIAGEGG